jgi:hypothetical protein
VLVFNTNELIYGIYNRIYSKSNKIINYDFLLYEYFEYYVIYFLDKFCLFSTLLEGL